MAYIPYGAYWSTPFARWQGEFADLHAMEFAAHVSKRALAARKIDVSTFDFAAYGLTVPQYRSFYGLPWFTGMLGAEHLTGPTLSQACATGARLLATAAGEFAIGAATTALLVSGDRTSNSPHVYYPAPKSVGGTGRSEDIVIESFNKDPFARCAMVETADNVAAEFGIDTSEQHDLALVRQEQYAEALKDDRAFQRRFMDAHFDIPDPTFRKTVATIEGDCGVYPPNPEKMAGLKPVREGGSVTFAAQTHPADGSAGVVMVSQPEKARELASRSDAPLIEVISAGQARVKKAHMPAAPIDAAHRALSAAGLNVSSINVFKSHNPFSVNDIAFARAFDLDWRQMNNYGCSLIWGHPQGPTGLRAIIEMIEELELKGGGYGLFQGCAAGDSAMSIVVRVG